MEISRHSLPSDYLLYSITKKKETKRPPLILFINIKFYKHKKKINIKKKEKY